MKSTSHSLKETAAFQKMTFRESDISKNAILKNDVYIIQCFLEEY
jgi:hypothetical protein